MSLCLEGKHKLLKIVPNDTRSRCFTVYPAFLNILLETSKQKP